MRLSCLTSSFVSLGPRGRVYAGLLEHCGEKGRLLIREEVEVTQAKLVHTHASIDRDSCAVPTAAKATTKAAMEAAPAAVAEVEDTAAPAAATETEARKAVTTGSPAGADVRLTLEKSLVLEEKVATTAEIKEV
eukprot:6174323-Pleurochrysis_carterae.AAC.3